VKILYLQKLGEVFICLKISRNHRKIRNIERRCCIHPSVECYDPYLTIVSSSHVMHLFLSSSPALDQHLTNESRIIDSSSANRSLFRLFSFRVQPKFICSCSNELAVLVWAGHEARPSPRAEFHHPAILEGKIVPTADPVTNAIRINSSQQLVEKGRLNYDALSHRKALLSWPSASHSRVSLCSLSPVLRSFFQLNPPMDLRSGSRSLCSLSPVLRSFFQLNPPMDLRSGSSQSKEDPSGSAQQSAKAASIRIRLWFIVYEPSMEATASSVL